MQRRLYSVRGLARPFKQRLKVNQLNLILTVLWQARQRSGFAQAATKLGTAASSVPNSVRRFKGRKGWLQFGRPDMDLGSAMMLQVQRLPSRLVLFPSTFWHGTAPFADADHRLTVAFEVVPD